VRDRPIVNLECQKAGDDQRDARIRELEALLEAERSYLLTRTMERETRTVERDNALAERDALRAEVERLRAFARDVSAAMSGEADNPQASAAVLEACEKWGVL